MNELVDILNSATEAYNNGHPIITDEEWDDFYFALVQKEKEAGFALPNSPTQSVMDFVTVNSLEKVEHNHLMLSLEKTKEIADINNFLMGKSYLAMCKMDGLTCSVRYLDGKLVSAETRGNGVIGENILHNAMTLFSIPKKIKYKGELVLDGEIICTYSDFETFSSEFKNPRNFAAGSIRLLDAKECSKRKLQFVVWDVIKGFEHVENADLNYILNLIDKLGFTTVPRFVKTTPVTEELINQIQEIAQEKGYPIDGVVFKFSDREYGKSLGNTAHHFKNAMAFKFYDEVYETEVLDVEWTMGRTGILTPVAILKPVEIDGTEVSRASLHNVSIMHDELKLWYKNQKVDVYKANMIIPQIAKVYEYDAEVACPLDPPEYCPVCGGQTEIINNNGVKTLMCINPACDGKLINRLDHFCSKKGLDIKGLSKATLEKLINLGWLNNIYDLYNLVSHKAEWVKQPGFGDKSVSKILDAIELSKNCTLADFISALGIPLIGKTVAKELVKYLNDYDDFRNKIQNNFDFTSIDGFGPAMDKALKDFDYNYADIIYCEYMEISNKQEEKVNTTLEGITVVITGKLKNFKNRDALKAEIEARGGKVAGSVTKNTKYLINNDKNSTSAKNISAQKLGVEVITEEEFLKFFDF